jgi:hypothetical protein
MFVMTADLDSPTRHDGARAVAGDTTLRTLLDAID